MKQTVIIADLHLSINTPQLNALLLSKLQEWVGNIDALYLLGDIYEAWIGNDYQPEEIQIINQALLKFSQTTPLFIMHGNRDFLMDKQFAASIGACLLPDPSVIDFYGKKYILSHGDSMCTDDVNYQRYRKIVRNPLFQWGVLKLPLAMRLKIAAKFRLVSSNQQQQSGQYQITDVTELGLQQLQQKLWAIYSCPLDLIHGHTHRPNIHQHLYQDQKYQRFVIPDWYDSQGGAIIVSEKQAPEIIYFDLAQKSH